jgi:hypothetical protein
VQRGWPTSGFRRSDRRPAAGLIRLGMPAYPRMPGRTIVRRWGGWDREPVPRCFRGGSESIKRRRNGRSRKPTSINPL